MQRPQKKETEAAAVLAPVVVATRTPLTEAGAAHRCSQSDQIFIQIGYFFRDTGDTRPVKFNLTWISDGN